MLVLVLGRGDLGATGCRYRARRSALAGRCTHDQWKSSQPNRTGDLVSWIYGERIKYNSPDGMGFESQPVRLNIDDINDIMAWIRDLGIQKIDVQGTSRPELDSTDYLRPVSDIATAHISEIRVLDIVGHLDRTDAIPDVIRLHIRCSPNGVVVDGMCSDQSRRPALRKVIEEMRERVRVAERNGVPAERVATLFVLVAAALLGILWLGWWYAAPRQWPGILFAGTVAYLALRNHPWRSFVTSYFRRHRATWFEQKSRKELTDERARQKADKRARRGPIIWAAVATVVAALSSTVPGVYLTGWLGGS